MVDPEALGDLLAAQWAGTEWLAALLAATHVAAVEEDHLGLQGEWECLGPAPAWFPGDGAIESPRPLVVPYLKNQGHHTNTCHIQPPQKYMCPPTLDMPHAPLMAVQGSHSISKQPGCWAFQCLAPGQKGTPA